MSQVHQILTYLLNPFTGIAVDLQVNVMLNVIMFNELRVRDWRLYCGCHRRTSAGTPFLICFTK